MSLIQEALKRREEDDGAGKPAKIHLAPPPAPAVPPGKPPAPRGWSALVGILVVILLLLGAAIGLLFFVARSIPGLQAAWKGSAGSGPAEAAVVEEAGTAEAVVPDIASAKALEVASASVEMPGPEGAAPAPVVEGVNAPAAATAGVGSTPGSPGFLGKVMQVSSEMEERKEETLAVSESAPAAPPPATPAPVETALERPAETAPAVVPRIWPDLRVTGVLRKGEEGASAAIINGELVSLNEEIEGAVLVGVESTGVWLEFQGEERFARIGRSVR